MGLNGGRLRATLVAGGIRPTDETLETLSAGLSGIAHGYHIERVIGSEAKSDTELTKELSQLHAAFRTVVSILDEDTSGLGQIELLLSQPGDDNRLRKFLEELRSLSSRIEVLLIMLAQNTAIRKRRQNPETWFFLAVHDLFATLTDDPKPGIAGPLYRFTKRCAALVEPRIKVPENENSFQKRLTAALGRRTGKIHVFPWRFIPGKTAPPI